ncbi:MAG: hypothetical protein SGPRY_012355 [Prymnesium sp.]
MSSSTATAMRFDSLGRLPPQEGIMESAAPSPPPFPKGLLSLCMVGACCINLRLSRGRATSTGVHACAALSLSWMGLGTYSLEAPKYMRAAFTNSSRSSAFPVELP